MVAKLPEGIAGVARLHAMIGEHLGEDEEAAPVVVGIETDRGPWVQALAAAGYQVYAINPPQVARYRERHGVSGAKSDAGDAHTLADMVRTDRHQLRPIAGDSVQAQAIKVVTTTRPPRPTAAWLYRPWSRSTTTVPSTCSCGPSRPRHCWPGRPACSGERPPWLGRPSRHARPRAAARVAMAKLPDLNTTDLNTAERIDARQVKNPQP